MIKEFIGETIKVFRAHENEEKGKQMSAYLKNQYLFFGIQQPERKRLQKSILEETGMPVPEELDELVRELWYMPQREFQLFALDLMVKDLKNDYKGRIKLYEWCVIQKSWWDTVDYIASRLIGEYIKKHLEERDQLIESWMQSCNMWLQRVCLLFQLKYKLDTDKELLFKLIKLLADHEDFFIRKAIGWILREYSKTNPEDVREFIKRTELSPLSVREGGKYL